MTSNVKGSLTPLFIFVKSNWRHLKLIYYLLDYLPRLWYNNYRKRGNNNEAFGSSNHSSRAYESS